MTLDRGSATLKRILVLHPGSLGDTILSLPALRDLKKHGPVSVCVAGKSSILNVLADAGEIDRAQAFDSAWIAELFGPGEILSPDAESRLRQHDLLVSWAGDGDGELPRHIAAYPGVHWIADRPVRTVSGNRPKWEEYRASVARIMPTNGPDYSPVQPGKAARDRGHDRIRRNRLDIGRSLMAIHPGAGSEAKQWSLDGFAAIGKEALRKGVSVVVFEGPAEVGVGARLAERIGGDACLLIVEGLLELTGVLSVFSSYVGNDAGPTHLAAALGLKTVALFQSTDPRIWAPWGANVIPISTIGDQAAVVRTVLGAIGTSDPPTRSRANSNT